MEFPWPRLNPFARPKTSQMNPYSRKSAASSRMLLLFASFSATRRMSGRNFMMRSSSSSLSVRIARNPRARNSPWLRCEPKMMSSLFSVNAMPTAAASCPVERCAGPV